MTFLLGVLRLSVVVAFTIWLPGWVASARPIRPVRVLYPSLLGVALHMLALIVAGALTSHVTGAAWIVPPVTFAFAFVVRRVVARRQTTAWWEPPALSRVGMVLVGALVVVAAVMRMLHNFHYDDLAHLVYLTEVRREDLLFPHQFFLEVTGLELPGAGPGRLLLSRYPYWAASYSVLGLLAAAPSGDAYLLLGLGVLALTLGLMAALVSAVWGARTGYFWVLALLATSYFASDNLLNYGGYPFQTGKVFVLLAATSVVVAWATRSAWPLHLTAVAIFVAPLFHTNNVVGASWVGGLVIVAVVVVPRLRRPSLLVLASFLLLGVTGLVSLGAGGFIRWVPDTKLDQYEALTPQRPRRAVAAAAAALSASVAPAPAQAQTPKPAVRRGVRRRLNSIGERLGLFLARGIPSEVLILLVAIVLAPIFGSWQRLGELFAPIALVAAGLVVGAACAAEASRMLITLSMKPGYWRMRSSLIELGRSLPNGATIVTDPVTDVFGRAAGWHVAQPLSTRDDQQRRRLFLFHPEVQGRALDAALASVGPSVIVANEFITRAESAQKFEAARLPVLGRSGRRPAAQPEPIDAAIPAVVDAVRRRDVRAVSTSGFALARAAVRVLAEPQQIQAFQSATPGPQVAQSDLGAVVRDNTGVEAASYLNSALITAPPTDGCVSALEVSLTNRSSFDLRVLVAPLDSLKLVSVSGDHLAPGEGATTTVTAVLDRPECGVGPSSFFLDSGWWWDGRFEVNNVEWRPASPEPARGPEPGR